jgi:hypothetical protein
MTSRWLGRPEVLTRALPGSFALPSFGVRRRSPLRNGLQVWWDGASLTEKVSGNSFTNSGSVNFSNDGLWGEKCATFPAGQTLSISDALCPGASVDYPGKLTWAWLWRLDSLGSNAFLLGKGATGTREVRMYYLAGNGAVWANYDGATTTQTAVGDYSVAGTTGNPSANEWVLSFMQADDSIGSNGQTFVTGCKVVSSATVGAGNPTPNSAGNNRATSNGPLTLGAAFGTASGTGFRAGFLGIWGRLLSTTEMQLIATRINAGQRPI